MPFGMEKLEWCGYPKVKKFDDIFSRFDRIPACDGQTDGQTDILQLHNPRRKLKFAHTIDVRMIFQRFQPITAA